MNIEEAKAHCEMLLNYGILSSEDEEPMKTVLTELEKKDRIIEKMAECIGQDIRCVRPEIECNKMTHDCRECVKEYFTNKVEREGK